MALLRGGMAWAGEAADLRPPPSAQGTERRVGEDLYLEVLLNGGSSGRLVHFLRSGDSLCASASELRTLGFTLAGSQTPLPCLGDLPGVRYHYDVKQQKIEIDADAAALKLPLNVLNAPDRPAAKTSTSTGAVLNYDLYASRGGGQGALSGFVELRAFAPGAGVLSNTSLVRRYQSSGGGWRGDSVRLDTQWRLAFPERALALTVGDTITDYLSWTRPTRIGGIAFGRDFALQPYQVTTPLPQFFGQATVPSAVELYVDGIRQYSGKVPAGPFQLTGAPGVSAGGQAQVVLTDALGRASTLSFPFYSARQLLRQGFSDWSVQLGTLRQDYGLRSFAYASAPLASATLRYGVSDQLTVESHLEGGDGRGIAGIGANWIPWNTGVLSGSLARAKSAGQQVGVGYSWVGRVFNFALDSLRSFGDYRDIAATAGAPVPRINQRVLVGMNIRRASFGLNYVQLRYPGQPASRYAGGYLLQTLGGGASINASLTQNLDQSRDRSIFLGLSLNLDPRNTFNFSLQREGDRNIATLDASHPVDGDGGFGWHLQGRAGPQGGGLAELGWLGNRGQLTAGISQYGQASYGYADLNGAVALIGGHPFLARRIDDAFALVSTDGTPGVPVLLENRPTGVTDSRGLLLVSRLNAYQDNRLSIDPMQLAADERVQRVESLVAPTDRAGALVRFPIRKVRAASVTLVDIHDQPLPLGSRVLGGGADGVVGYDGQTYLDQLPGRSTPLRVELPDGGHCGLTLEYPAHARVLPQLGPLRCLPVAQP